MKLTQIAFLAVLMPFNAFAADAPDVAAALNEWKAAVEGGSVDNILKLYDSKAVMISTFVQNPMTKRLELKDYYQKVVVNPDVKVEIEETHPRRYGELAVNSGRYTLSYTQEGEEISIPARFSFTYALENGKWMIVDHHSSKMPMTEIKK